MTPLNNLRFTAMRSTAIILALASSSTLALTAQEGKAGAVTPPMTKQDDSGKTQVEYASIQQMVGAPVYLEASAEAKAEANREGEAAARPKAEVTEWLIDSRDGTLSKAVVSIGGFLGIGDKSVLVSSKELTWNNAMGRYDLGWTKDQLKAKPAFDLDAATKSGLDAACDMKATDVKVADAAGTRETAIAGTTFMRTNNCLAKATELAALPVYAGTEDWGKVKDLIVDRSKGRVVLAVVNHGSTLGMGGTDYLVAYPHFAVATKDKDARLLCASSMTPSMLEACVKFEKPKNGVVDPSAAKQALANSKMDKPAEVKN